jgi:integrase
VEAARTAVRVLRHMYSWAIDEEKLKRQDNPCRKIAKNLPKAKRGEVVLSLREARVVWQAAKDCGYPFGTHAQQMMLSGCRMAEWAEVEARKVDLEEALLVVSADDYKTDHVHVIPLVPQALEILRAIPKPTLGPYVFSSTGGSKPIKGIAQVLQDPSWGPDHRKHRGAACKEAHLARAEANGRDSTSRPLDGENFVK